MTKPQRTQLRRTKGFNLRAESLALIGLRCVSVARPGRRGNPFRVGVDGDAAECVRKYAEMMTPDRHHGQNSTLDAFYISEMNIQEIRRERGGKNLACYCPLKDADGNEVLCHASVLLILANI